METKFLNIPAKSPKPNYAYKGKGMHNSMMHNAIARAQRSLSMLASY
jgi:hypothetical protein